MKKLLLLSILFFSSFAIISCGDDDDATNEPENVLIYDGTEYDLESGYIADYGAWNGVYNFDISLFSTEVTFVDGEMVPEDNILSGIYFEMWTDNAENLEIGTYVYSDSEESGTFSYAEAAIEYNYTEENEEALRFINEGTIEILQNGPTYEIVFNCVAINDIVVSGHYEGTLIVENIMDEEDSSTERMKNSKKSFSFKKKN